MTMRLIKGQRLRLFLKQGGRCFYCDRQMIMAERAPKRWRGLMCTRDHVIARSVTKPPGVRNRIVGACQKCNVEKDTRSAYEFMTHVRFRGVVPPRRLVQHTVG